MQIELSIQSLLNPDWSITHIINLSPGWQVNLKSDEHVVVATGETIEEALSAASVKINNHDYNGTLFRLASARLPEAQALSGRSLLASLGLTKPSIKRRI